MSDQAAACACGTCTDCASGSAAATGALDAARWRHAVIRERLLKRIGRVVIDDRRALAGLTTRRLDDPAIALVDAFAGSLHVLAWNATRLGDDATLARSQDPQALADLVALTGYRPRPALSATTILAYTLDAFPGAPGEAVIPAGNRVASLPAPGELPVIFETGAPLLARPAWNVLLPVVPKIARPVTTTTVTFDIDGVAFTGKPGSLVAASLTAPEGGKAWLVGQVVAVTILDKVDPPRVRLTLGGTATVGGAAAGVEDGGTVILLDRRALAFGATSPDPLLLLRPTGTAGADPVLDQIDRPATGLPEWKNLRLTAPGATGGAVVDLDGGVSEALAGRLMLIGASTGMQAARITAAVQVARRGFGMSGTVTRTAFSGVDVTATDGEVRSAWFAVETARFPLLATSDPAATIAAGELVVEGDVTLPPGRALLLTGAAFDIDAGAWVERSEVVTITATELASADPPRTRLVVAEPLVTRFRVADLAIWGNVVPASHGESTPTGAELLGSSDSAILNPRFTLPRRPLTQLPAEGGQGYAPALEVRVDGRRYDPVPDLFDVPADARAYRVETVGEGRSAIRFAGRLPTAANSVSAVYRAGAGAAGNLNAGRLSTALAPVPGVRAVTNPFPADGGSDAEPIEAIRSAAPRQLRTFDRVVSLGDVEAFASGYRGVGKALASELRVGIAPMTVLTVASTSLRPPSQALIDALGRAIGALSPPGRRLRVQGFTPVTATLTIAFAADPAVRRADVEAAIRAMLGARFGAAQRRFGDGLARSAVIAAVQAVPGVTAVLLKAFGLATGASIENGRLLVPGPRAIRNAAGGITYSLAALLAIDPQGVQFEEWAA